MKNLSKKILAIASDHPNKSATYKKQIESLFHDKIIIKELHVTENTFPSKLDLEFDVALICAEKVFYLLKPFVKKDVPLIMFKRTISKSAFDLISKIPPRSDVAIYGSDSEMESVIMTRLYTLGLTSITFFPYTKFKNRLKKFDAIVVLDDKTNERKYNINHDNIIFTGPSMLDISTIVDLAIKLDLEDYIFHRDITSSFKELASADFGFANTLKKAKLCESYLAILLDIVNKGVLGIDSSGSIKIFNNLARTLLKFNGITMIRSNAFELFPFIPFKEVLERKQIVKDMVLPYEDTHLIVSIAPMAHSGKVVGAIATLKKYTDAEKEQDSIRAQIMDKGHTAKHNFNDIISVSKEMDRCKSIAKIMASSDSSVLITGETGTGKEMFAQSIHNCSPRRNQPFVALNCGALPESLMESELFGYEEGSFTGAKKGGKQGLFELAHNGTIFLDEIAEMPPYLQLKLLRVIQEREIMRIGGDRIIKINIRIIAATNQNLKKAVEEQRFRDDLYYRLNVLPLNIPPLRHRKDDILPLFNFFKEKLKGRFTLSEDAKEIIKNYNWNGNTRELRNVVEYLTFLDFDIVEAKDLPIRCTEVEKASISKVEKDLIDKFLISIDGELDKYLFVLSELYDSYENNTNIGRRKIYKSAVEKGLYLTEHQIRKILAHLESFSMIDVSKGRGGSSINKFGINTFNYLNDIVR